LSPVKKKDIPRLVRLNSPTLIDEGGIENGKITDTSTGKPRKKKSLIIIITLSLATFFATTGIAMFSSIGGIMVGFLTSFVTGITGWDTITITLFLMAIFLFIAVVLYAKYKAGTSLSKELDQKLFGQYYKYDDIDLSSISIHQLAGELKNKGCIVMPADGGKNIAVLCPEKFVMDKIEKSQKKENITKKVVAIIVSSIIVGISLLIYFLGLVTPFLGSFDWIVILVGIALALFILLNAVVIKMFVVPIVVVVVLATLFLLNLIDFMYLWLVIGICASIIILVGALYYLKGNFKETGSWIYDFL
jgi:MFS family permease